MVHTLVTSERRSLLPSVGTPGMPVSLKAAGAADTVARMLVPVPVSWPMLVLGLPPHPDPAAVSMLPPLMLVPSPSDRRRCSSDSARSCSFH